MCPSHPHFCQRGGLAPSLKGTTPASTSLPTQLTAYNPVAIASLKGRQEMFLFWVVRRPAVEEEGDESVGRLVPATGNTVRLTTAPLFWGACIFLNFLF